MKRSKKFAIQSISLMSKIYFRFFKEKNSLLTFLFHAIARNEKEIQSNVVNPNMVLTIDHFRQFLKYYLDHGYMFISPNDILKGLSSERKYVLITFDDGYYNNKHVLPILKEYQVPAVFFVSTNHVKFNKSFWWDVLYRERIKRGSSLRDIKNEQQQLKKKTHEEIDKYLKKMFGEKAFKPVGDFDRPFTPSELNKLSKERYVFIGNHTSDHAILINYPRNGIKSQILGAKNAIRDITGIEPIIISYPNGDYSDDVIRISREIGLRLGITFDHRKNYLPLDFRSNDPMCLGRFSIEGRQVINQCEIFRLDTPVYGMIQNSLRIISCRRILENRGK